jgi:hypothetical protein
MSVTNVTNGKMPAHRKRSLLAGWLYILTFVSIPSLALYKPAKTANYILSSGGDASAILGALLEVTIAVAGIATAVVLFPILKRQNESAAIGLVAARVVESASILVGVAFILTIVTLHQDGAGAAALPMSHTLALLYDRIFLLSQSFMPAVCDLLLGFLLWKSRLVPRKLAGIGIAGGPLLLVGYLLVMTGALDQHSKVAGLSAIGVFVFELSLGIWLVVKGFNPKAVAALENQA